MKKVFFTIIKLLRKKIDFLISLNPVVIFLPGVCFYNENPFKMVIDFIRIKSAINNKPTQSPGKN